MPAKSVMDRSCPRHGASRQRGDHTALRTAERGGESQCHSQQHADTDELFISENFPLNILDCSWLHRTENTDYEGSTCSLLQDGGMERENKGKFGHMAKCEQILR